MKKKLLASVILAAISTSPSVYAVNIYDSEEQKSSNVPQIEEVEEETIDPSTIDSSNITSMRYADYYVSAGYNPDQELPSVYVTSDRLENLKKRMKVQSKSDAKSSSGLGMKIIYPTQYEGVDRSSYTSLTEALEGALE